MAGALALAALDLLAGALGLGVWRWVDLEGGSGPDGEGRGPARGGAPGSLPGAARAFWIALRVGQLAAVLFAVAVGVLAAAGRYSSEHLFYLYALLPLAVAFVAEQLRVAAAQTILDQRGLEGAAAVGELPASEQHRLVGAIVRREIGVMAASALVVVFLALRAAGTAHGF